jgi:hypothetical protein
VSDEGEIIARLKERKAFRRKIKAVPETVGVYRVQMKPYPTRVDVEKNPAFWAAHDAAKTPRSARAAAKAAALDAEGLIEEAREAAEQFTDCKDAENSDLCTRLADALIAAIRAETVAATREECAKLADAKGWHSTARAIRALSPTAPLDTQNKKEMKND